MLFADLNVAPSYTLDTVEDIVTNQNVNKLVGMAITLKMSDFKLAEEIPAWIERVKSWGFQYVRTRQLAFNRKEICLVAARDKFAIRKTKTQK